MRMDEDGSDGTAPMPLAGLRVLDFGHTVMGPACGLVLADLGAEVIRIEPPGGDRTRRLQGFARGFFATFNRNKRSLALDLKDAEGRAIVEKLVATADVVVENFAPGTMERLGLGWERLHALNPRLILCSLKGYLPGPYESFAALDEVVQMQGGLAYMTGPPGQPLRAGTSVVDITGGVFGAVAILAALRERDRTGRGSLVQSGLFETVAFLVAQHIAAAAMTGQPLPPMPVRPPAWVPYDTLPAADAPVFVATTTDAQWQRLCASFGLEDLGADPALRSNAGRIAGRERVLAGLREAFAGLPAAEVLARCRAAGLPCAPVARPQDLAEDPHLRSNGRMAEVALPGGLGAWLPLLPIALQGHSPPLRRQPPSSGEAGAELLREIGLDDAAIAELAARGVVELPGEGAATL
jgi:crotonobetainyl-CoA:carnitine CoA-transferase CaiB-like acyl-CoA transferase